MRKKAALTVSPTNHKHARTQRANVENDVGVEVNVDLLAINPARAGGARDTEAAKSRGPNGQAPKLGAPGKGSERVHASMRRAAAGSWSTGRGGPFGFVLQALKAQSRVNRSRKRSWGGATEALKTSPRPTKMGKVGK